MRTHNSEPGQDLVGRQFGFEPPGQRDDSWSPATWPEAVVHGLELLHVEERTSSELCSSRVSSSAVARWFRSRVRLGRSVIGS